MTTREQAMSHGDRKIVVTRVFDAPREMLWHAWTDPEMQRQWFAPEPLTVPFAEADVRPGGRYRFVMRDEEGRDYPSVGEYRDVEEPERLVYTDSIEEMPKEWVEAVNEARGAAPDTPVTKGIVTLTFRNLAGETEMTFEEEFDSQATRDAYVQMQMVEGLEGTYDNLERLLSRMPSMTR